MVSERKSKLEICEQIMEVLGKKKIAWSFQQLAKELGSHWLIVRECCLFMEKYKAVKIMETKDHKFYVQRGAE